ncbi:MAG: superoxide dismutase [Bacilli bacterium]|nr:superoxide dismutase [Bacilli bacterium]
MYSPINLPYSINSLEPYIDGETMMIHYGKHYMNYLNKLNDLLSKYNFNFDVDKEFIFSNINQFNEEDRNDILHNLGGVVNHELYFLNIAPKNRNVPIGSVNGAINNKYGGFDNFKEEFINKAKDLKGSGYVFLVLTPMGELDIISLYNQDSPYNYGLTPIMAMDVWEHAYYLKRKNEKDKYFEDFFNVVNFSYVNNLYEDKKM